MKNWFKVFFLYFLLGLLVFSNSFQNKFLIDDFYFLGNPVLSDTKFLLSQWDPYREQVLGVLDSHASVLGAYYRPLQNMVLDLCYTVFKYNFWQYHLFNLILFVLASSLIYLFIHQFTKNYFLACLAGLFYLIHPINGIIVNYITASNFAFQVIFTIGTILLLLGSLERKNDRPLYILSLIFAFLSLFWHESGMMVPFYTCAAIIFLRKDPIKEKVLYLFPYFLIVFIFILFRKNFLSSNVTYIKYIFPFHTGWEYLAALFQILSWYISKLFFPQGIVMIWTPPVLNEHVTLNAIGMCLMFIIFLLLFVKFSKVNICQLALAWVFIGFAPLCLVAFRLPNVGVYIEPHWFVFSSIGFYILAAYFCLKILERTKKIGIVLLFILIFAWGSVSHANNQLWADQKTYALYWSKLVPSLNSTYFYIADGYYREGNLKESKKYYKLALSRDLSDTGIYNNLGLIDQADGHFKDAESDYKMALKIDPHLAAAYLNLGNLYFTEGRLDRAKENYDQALMLNPPLLEPRTGLAHIFLKHSEYQKAIDLCLKNLDIKNNDPETLLLLATIYIQKKDFIKLKDFVYHLISFETDPKFLTRLGVTLAENNAPVIAIDCFEKAILVAPDYQEAYFDGGTLAAKLGNYDEAIRIWKIGLSIDPADQRFKQSIAQAMGLKLK